MPKHREEVAMLGEALAHRMAAAAIADRRPAPRPEIVDAISTHVAEDWDAVAAGRVLASRDWLLALEEAGIPGVEPRYALVREGGRPVGAAVCYVNRGRQPGLDPDDLLLGQLKPMARWLGFTFSPALVNAPFRGYGVQLFGPAREAMLDELEALARRERLPLHIPRVPDEEADLCRLLLARGYHRTADQPLARLDIAWDSFDGYLKALKRVGPKAEGTVRREINRNRRAGVEIREIADVTAFADGLHELAEAHELRRNGARPSYPPSLLPRLKERLGGRCTVYGAFKGDRLTGFAVLLHDGSDGYLPFFGLDGSRADFTYFNLCYYQPIRDAIAGGLKRLHFGRLMCELKMRRGCRILRTSRFYKGATPPRHLAAAAWFSAHARVAERRFASAHALAGVGT
jgi:predicted N-acyltransferase